MRLVTIKSKYLKHYKVDPEMLQKAKRPCVLVVRLKYKGRRYHFAVPLRSNIAPSTPKDQYFPLPPRSTTKPTYRHGIHYIKMFPVQKDYLIRYRTEGNPASILFKAIIDANENQIIQDCQRYLYNYERGIRNPYSTNIDLLISQMNANDKKP